MESKIVSIFDRKKIGEILIERGLLTPVKVDEILQKQKYDKTFRFGELCLKENLITEEDLVSALAEQFNLEYLDLKYFKIDQNLYDLFPQDIYTRYVFLPYAKRGDALIITVSDPTNIKMLDELEILVDMPLTLTLSSERMINKALKNEEKSKKILKDVSDDLKLHLVKETDKGEEELSLEKLNKDTSPIVKLVDSTIYDAIYKRSSDIHIETNQNGVIIKYRIDGLLYKATDYMDISYQSAIISRIKVMSELDITEKRIPQDGRFKLRLKNKAIDFRVSIMPSVFGEDAVIRILDKESLSEEFGELRLNILGFRKEEINSFRVMIHEPYGMILVTGPTGSGKTTTLYAALNEINREDEKIITIEDPVEYQLSGILQIPVNEKKGLTFVRGLRSILRHDPDKIMVGEIRDPETAQIAIQSALTGHMVFTTVHANNAFDIIGRFMHMNIDPYNFVYSLNCVLAQRLVRTICPDCKAPYKYDKEFLEYSKINFDEHKDYKFFKGKGCINCNGSGYRGRTAIFELLKFTDSIKELVTSKPSYSALKRAAKEQGTIFLRDAAIEKALKGITTLEDINRVTFVE
jgi:type IV pilus assembly protein PilB